MGEEFRGDIIHPQEWPEDFDYEGKNIVVIGSGATAATIVPAMSKKAKHVTMLQRSPTYYASAPDEDAIALFLNKFLPRENKIKKKKKKKKKKNPRKKKKKKKKKKS